MQEKILMVDDDEQLLAAMQRTIGRRYNLVTASSGEAALLLLAKQNFAVIVSDLRMPTMDGIAFLARCQALTPDSTRIMLTGNADLKIAMDAINESQIFRFLTKPVAQTVMVKALEAGLAQYRLVVAEHELLSKTLVGSVQILLDVLRSLYPGAFQITHRIRQRTRRIAEQLGLADVWQFELAAILSQVGFVTAPPQILSKLQAGEQLIPREQQLLSEHIANGQRLLANIPRLELIAEMVGRQNHDLPRSTYLSNLQERDVATVGAQILQIATNFEYLYVRYQSEQAAVIHMYHENRYDPRILDGLRATLSATD